ncbi:MAG: neutral zinc metallopeptidase [Bacteroidia bacterium]|nr:neutral zinc metallopeptidase [Bacteroidia bacterium]
MRWQGRQGSSNVEDRRGGRGGGRRAGASFGIGTVIIIIIALLFGKDPMQVLQQVQSGSPQETTTSAEAPNDEMGQFVSVVLKETEDVWDKLFQEQLNRRYTHPTLVLFSGSTQSGCGFASEATGPFYCPADQSLYIDLSFYNELKNRFGAPGDFAMAYVVAHEVAHHVQNLLGITDQVHAQRRRISQEEYNDLSVRLELQADFLSGVWARHVQQKNLLEQGDVEEALRAANAIGDDRLQMQSQGYVVPESFTHGTSEQRMNWFRKGFETGDLSQGDTFNARSL